MTNDKFVTLRYEYCYNITRKCPTWLRNELLDTATILDNLRHESRMRENREYVDSLMDHYHELFVLAMVYNKE